MADKDVSKEPSSSEYTSETSDPDYEERPASLFGTLRTRLNWQPSSRTMHLDVRQTLQVRSRQQLQPAPKAKTNTRDSSNVSCWPCTINMLAANEVWVGSTLQPPSNMFILLGCGGVSTSSYILL
jgi:hypothetical protein